MYLIVTCTPLCKTDFAGVRSAGFTLRVTRRTGRHMLQEFKEGFKG